jgi:hypothetical protein
MLRHNSNELSELVDGLQKLEDAKTAMEDSLSELKSILYHLGRTLPEPKFSLLVRRLHIPSAVKWEVLNSLQRDNIYQAEHAIKAIRAEE